MVRIILDVVYYVISYHAGKNWRQEKGAIEDQMVGWHHWLNGYEFEQTHDLATEQQQQQALLHIFYYSENSLPMKTIWANLCGLFLDCLFGYTDICSCPHCLETTLSLLLEIYSKSYHQALSPPTLFFSVKVLWAIVGPMAFHVSFRISLSTFEENWRL